MRQRKPLTGVLVIVELGAEWPAWTGTGVELAARGGRRVLSQEEGESPEAFADRVAEHLGSLFARQSWGRSAGRPRDVLLERAVLACNERTDDRAMQARSKLGQTLLRALAERRSWQLLFTASGRTGRVRHSLSELATTLSSVWTANGGGVGVRFGDEMPLVRQAESAA